MRQEPGQTTLLLFLACTTTYPTQPACAYTALLIPLTHPPPRGEPLPAAIITLQPTVILAAECVYYEPAFPLLQQTLQDLLTLCPAATVFFCFKKRRRADLQFVKRLRKAFVVADAVDDERPVWGRQGLFLYTITSKGGGERGSDAAVVASS